MRVELVFPYSPNFNNTQYYVNCAHIEVKGEGKGEIYPLFLSHATTRRAKQRTRPDIHAVGTPGPMVKFPGAYDDFDRCKFMPLTSNGWRGCGC